MTEPPAPTRRVRWPVPPELAALLIVAEAIRIAVYFALPNIHYPDEIFQTLEPAHRLVFGSGLLSWEWIFGIRSWLLPGIFAALMEVGRLFGDAPLDTNLPVIFFMIAASLAPVACGYLWGRGLFARWGGIVTGGIAALWIDLVYMASHTLTEVLAADVLPVALYLGYPGTGAVSRRRVTLAGAMLGLTFALRFHLTPALAVAAIGICGVRHAWDRWAALLAGASVPFLALGLLDWATLGAPFQSVFLNVWMNVGLHIADEAGTQPFMTLFVLPLDIWGIAGFIAMVVGAAIGARRLPLLGLVAVTIFLTHSVIAHKEYRFVYPAIPLLAILAGLGTAAIVRELQTRWPRLGDAAPAALALAVWAGLSADSGTRPIFDVPWTRERAQMAAFDAVAQRPEICGLGLYTVHWAMTPGESWLPPNLPLYQAGDNLPASESAAFNAIIARKKMPPPDARYRRIACFAGDRKADGLAYVHLCLWLRRGGCDAKAAPAPKPNWPGYFTGKKPVLEEYDQDAEP